MRKTKWFLVVLISVVSINSAFAQSEYEKADNPFHNCEKEFGKNNLNELAECFADDTVIFEKKINGLIEEVGKISKQVYVENVKPDSSYGENYHKYLLSNQESAFEKWREYRDHSCQYLPYIDAMTSDFDFIIYGCRLEKTIEFYYQKNSELKNFKANNLL